MLLHWTLISVKEKKNKDSFSCSAKTRNTPNTSFKYEGLFPRWHSAVVISLQHRRSPLAAPAIYPSLD